MYCRFSSPTSTCCFFIFFRRFFCILKTHAYSIRSKKRNQSIVAPHLRCSLHYMFSHHLYTFSSGYSLFLRTRKRTNSTIHWFLLFHRTKKLVKSPLGFLIPRLRFFLPTSSKFDPGSLVFILVFFFARCM